MKSVLPWNLGACIWSAAAGAQVVAFFANTASGWHLFGAVINLVAASAWLAFGLAAAERESIAASTKPEGPSP